MKRKNFFFISLPFVVLLFAVGLYIWDNRGPQQTETVRRLVILYTNDDHGWMEPSEKSGGAPGLAHLWQRDRAGADEPVLILSGGDLWTGPAVSTVLHGESMVDVMNALGYDAAAIGNHDFDYGLDNLIARSEQAEFPFLAANIRDPQTGAVPAFAHPFTIQEVNGIKVGLIGLTTLETPTDTRLDAVKGLEFLPYKQALKEVAPQARQAGADLLVVVSHLCNSELQQLAPLAGELGIAVMGGGHCHEELNETRNNVTLVQSGYFWSNYIRLELFFDIETDQVINLESRLVRNRPGRGDAAMAEQVGEWQRRAEQAYPGLWDVIGYTEEGLDRSSEQMHRLITEAWLQTYPEADVVLTSQRYIQQPVPPGNLTPANLIAVMSTENVLYELEWSGEQLVEAIERFQPVVGGVEELAEGYFIVNDGQRVPLDPASVYRVLIPSNLYHGAGNFDVEIYDDTPINTGIEWRAPVIDYLRQLGSSKDRPLEGLLDEI